MKVVRYIRAEGKRRKVGMIGKMTEEKAREMIEKKIVEEYNGKITRPTRETKLRFDLRKLITHT